jgi:hypothetical protein
MHSSQPRQRTYLHPYQFSEGLRPLGVGSVTSLAGVCVGHSGSCSASRFRRILALDSTGIDVDLCSTGRNEINSELVT